MHLDKIIATLTLVAYACTATDKTSNPDTRTSAVFPISASIATNVVVKAFSNNHYRGMLLEPPEIASKDAPEIRTTNGFLLVPILGPITNVLYKKSFLPYRPYFQIFVEPVNSAKTRVVIRTVKADVVDGLTIFAPHGGKAERLRKIPPIREEETNVLKAIEQQTLTHLFDTKDSYAVVMHLSNDFKSTGNIDALKTLADLVPSDKFGPNAAAGLRIVARKVTPKQAESLIIPALVRGLGSTNVANRRESAIALVEYSAYAEPVVPVLINFLNHSNEADRLNADGFVIETLGQLGPKASAAIPALLKVIDWPETNFNNLGDDSPRATAVAAIDQIGFSDAVTRLRLEKALEDREPNVKYASASALIDNGFISEAAVKTLSQAIDANDITVTLKPTTFQLINKATTNSPPGIQKEALTFLRKLMDQSTSRRKQSHHSYKGDDTK